MSNIQLKAEKHLAALQLKGSHYSVYCVTDANTIKLTRFLRRYLIKQLGHRPQYHLFWLHTSQGTLIYISSDMTVRRIISQLYKEATALQHCSTASQVYVGNSKRHLADAIACGVDSYKPKGNHAHSVGGSVLTGVNK